MIFKIREDKTFKSLGIWGIIENSYIKLIGLGERAEEIKELKIKLHGHYCDYINGNLFSDNWIRITKNNIAAIEKSILDEVSMSNGRKLIILQRNTPYKIDKYNTTVLEFHEMEDDYIELSKEREAA